MSYIFWHLWSMVNLKCASWPAWNGCNPLLVTLTGVTEAWKRTLKGKRKEKGKKRRPESRRQRPLTLFWLFFQEERLTGWWCLSFFYMNLRVSILILLWAHQCNLIIYICYLYESLGFDFFFFFFLNNVDKPPYTYPFIIRA